MRAGPTRQDKGGGTDPTRQQFLARKRPGNDWVCFPVTTQSHGMPRSATGPVRALLRVRTTHGNAVKRRIA